MSSPATQRNELLDALRGFALFGVIWSDFAMFSYWVFMSPHARAALPGSLFDGPSETFHSVFIDGKFYSIFSLLFGIGFGFFLGKGSQGLMLFYRRILVMLVLTHLWEGAADALSGRRGS